MLRISVRRRIAKTHRLDPLAKPNPARVRSWTSRISPCLRCLTPHEAALSVVGMSTLPALNRLPPITIGASHRLRLVHFRSPGPQAQDTALRRSYDDLPPRGARALWPDGTPGQMDRPRLSFRIDRWQAHWFVRALLERGAHRRGHAGAAEGLQDLPPRASRFLGRAHAAAPLA